MMLLQHQLLENTTNFQVLYFNSLVNKERTSRNVLLVSSTNEGNIVLTNVQPIYLNESLTYSYQSNFTTNFSASFYNYVINCQNQQDLQLAFLGNSSFLLLCPSSDSLVSFSIQSNETYLFSFEGESLGNIASNPQLLLPANSDAQAWNSAVLSQNKSNIRFCLFQGPTMNCTSFAEEKLWL